MRFHTAHTHTRQPAESTQSTTGCNNAPPGEIDITTCYMQVNVNIHMPVGAVGVYVYFVTALLFGGLYKIPPQFTTPDATKHILWRRQSKGVNWTSTGHVAPSLALFIAREMISLVLSDNDV